MDISYFFFGFLGGLLGGMGMGGGTLLIPLLTLGLGVEQQTAQLYNLAAFIPMSFVALSVHAKNGYIVYNKLWILILSGAASAVAGAFLATAVQPEILRKAFGAFLVATGSLYVVYQIFSKKKA